MALIAFAVIGLGSWLVGAITLGLFLGAAIQLRNTNGKSKRRNNNVR